VYELASSDDKTIKRYEGLYHEILNEPERAAVVADMLAWLDAHAGSAGNRRQDDAAPAGA
jgi:lysophospholipase